MREQNGIGSRLKQARESLKYTQSGISSAVGSKLRSWQEYEKGSRVPGSQVIAGLTRLGVNANWVLTGEGQMMLSDQVEEKSDDFAYVTRWNIEVSAGHGADVPDQEIKLEDVAFRKDWLRKQGLTAKELAIFTARGDSMEPTIVHGDMLLIKVFREWRHSTAPDEGIYIIRIDGHLHAKRIQSDGRGGILVKSDNQAYDTIRIEKDTLGGVDIVGRVVWIGRAMA